MLAPAAIPKTRKVVKDAQLIAVQIGNAELAGVAGIPDSADKAMWEASELCLYDW